MDRTARRKKGCSLAALDIKKGGLAFFAATQAGAVFVG